RYITIYGLCLRKHGGFIMENLFTTYFITNLHGEITFIDDSFLKLMDAKREEVIGHKLGKFVTFPFGTVKGINDSIALFLGIKKEISREGIIFNNKIFAVASIHKYPHIDNGKVIGVIYKTNADLDQFAKNSCLNVLDSGTYKGLYFYKTDIKLLMILAQFKNIKAKDIAKCFNLKTKTVYMYKNSLIQKIKAVSEGGTICYNEVLRHIILNGFYVNYDQRYVCLPLTEFSLYSRTPFKTLKKTILSLKLPKEEIT
ncbi:PAS domain-containing protein, partial [Piscirickettsia salmonis]